MLLLIVSDVNVQKSGSNSYICDKTSGKCDCNDNVIGDECTQCESGYWDFPSCHGEQYLNILHIICKI